MTASATRDKGRYRPKFSFRPLPHRGNSSEHTALKDRNENPVKYATEGPTLFNKCEHGTVGDLVAEMFENLHEESDKLPMKVAPHDKRSEVPSVAELLENLQQKDEPSTGPPNLVCIPNLCLFDCIVLMIYIQFFHIHINKWMFNI